MRRAAHHGRPIGESAIFTDVDVQSQEIIPPFACLSDKSGERPRFPREPKKSRPGATRRLGEVPGWWKDVRQDDG
jgi:hypothetical protein